LHRKSCVVKSEGPATKRFVFEGRAGVPPD
jgi:hypothetical protein